MISDWEQYREQQEVDPETAKQNTAHAERMVSRMRTVDLSTREPIATDEATEAHECETRSVSYPLHISFFSSISPPYLLFLLHTVSPPYFLILLITLIVS